MWPWWLFVHVCAANWSVFIANFQQGKYFILTTHITLSHILDIDTLLLILMNFEIVFLWVQQISDLLIVNLDKGDFHCKFNFFRRWFNSIEETSNHSWNYSLFKIVIYIRSKHRMGLTRTRLSICENGTIIPLKATFNDRQHSSIVNFHLICICIKSPIESIIYELSLACLVINTTHCTS